MERQPANTCSYFCRDQEQTCTTLTTVTVRAIPTAAHDPGPHLPRLAWTCALVVVVHASPRIPKPLVARLLPPSVLFCLEGPASAAARPTQVQSIQFRTSKLSTNIHETYGTPSDGNLSWVCCGRTAWNIRTSSAGIREKSGSEPFRTSRGY
jgi:hypothetical protein